MRNLREEILNQIDLVELVSEYVTLERAGRNFKALCPFHTEKTPSFFVSPALNRFHCFGCGASGDAIGFLMRIEGLSYRDALRRLAERAGIEIERDTSRPESDDSRERLYRIVYAAHFYYRQCLRRTPEALQYLQTRGLTPETIERFELGFAPDGWDYLVRFLQKHQMSLEEARTAGLVEEGRNGYYDRFRNRITFPIHDAGGRVVAFGARTMGNDEPKYLNSPETPLFEKRNLFYGWHLARGDILKQRAALIVEGYLDLIMLHQFGFTHAIATLGTAFTESHAQRLKRLVDRVYLMYDSDSAGIPTFVVSLPEGEDPDSLLRQHGAEALNQCLQRASTLALFGLEQIVQNRLREANAASPAALDVAARTQLLEEALQWVARVPSEVERLACLERLVPFNPTTTLGTPLVLETLQNQVRQIQRRMQRATRSTPSGNAPPETRPRPEIRVPKGLQEAERTVLRALLHPRYQKTIAAHLPRLRWAAPEHARLAAWLQTRIEGETPLEARALIESAESEDMKQLLTALLIQETPALSGEGVEGCLQRMEQPLQSRNSEPSHESNP